MIPTDRKDGAIRVVDFGKFLDGSQKQEVADAILDSFKEIGFVYLINYGLTQQKIASIFETVSTSMPSFLSRYLPPFAVQEFLQSTHGYQAPCSTPCVWLSPQRYVVSILRGRLLPSTRAQDTQHRVLRKFSIESTKRARSPSTVRRAWT